MRLLVLHAWLRGNLGDVLQLSVLLRSLRELSPAVLDLAGHPAQPAPETAEVIGLADRYLPDTFPWYWSMAPAPARRAVFEPWWRRRRRRLFSRYDAVVCAPGPYLAEYDRRATSALCDIAVAADLKLPVVLSSHSIGPLSPSRLEPLTRAAVRVARELSTYEYLRARGMSAVPSSDLAFLYPYAPGPGPAPVTPPYRLVFLRSNNLDAGALSLQGGALFHGGERICDPSSEPIVLATSDYRRDGRFLTRAARRLRVRWIFCRSVPELVQLVAGSSSVVSDRYHPAICAAALGKPAHVVPNREPHKMEGLRSLLGGRPLSELQDLARAGLRAVHDALSRQL